VDLLGGGASATPIGSATCRILATRGPPERLGERWVITAFGIRGAESLCYLVCAVSHAAFSNVDVAWATAPLPSR